MILNEYPNGRLSRAGVVGACVLAVVAVPAWSIRPSSASGTTASGTISAQSGPAPADDLKATIKGIEQAKSATWKTTYYFQRTAKDDEPRRKWLDEHNSESRQCAYKKPGLYREVLLDKNGQARWIHIEDTARRTNLDLFPPKRKAVVQHLIEANQDPNRPFRVALQYLKTDLECLGKKNIAGRMANGFRHSYWEAAYPTRWSYDFWIDSETKQLVACRVPGLDILDPDKIYKEPALPHVKRGGFLMHDVAFNVELDDSLFEIKPPQGYAVEVVDPPKITEGEVIAFLRVVAEFYDKRFPDRLLRIHEGDALIKFERAEDAPEEERTPTEQAMIEVMHKYWSMGIPGPGPLYVFVHHEIVEGSWKYLGKGVMLGDKDRIVCWYRPLDSKTYRVVYGDLSIKDVAAENLPLPVER
jgi:hypothetical protein